MAVHVLGPLETGTAPLSPRERAVLSALVVRAGTPVSPAELAEAYWGDATPATWAQQVKTAVARIRQRLGYDAVETVGSDYRLGLDVEAVDARRFEHLVRAAREHGVRGEHDRAVDAYSRALAMWRGTALPDLPSWQPGVDEAMRLDTIRRSAEEELLEARLRAGEHREVVPEAERLVREDPLREDRWAILALATYRSNRQGEALAVLRTARARLADELGVDPGRRLTELETAILRHDPALAPDLAAPRVSDECPYRGLESFGPDDAAVFFGRDADVGEVVDRARPGAVVAIAGPSGSGKSSLLLAGVVPALAERGRSVRVLHPGAARLAEIRGATEGPGRVDVVAIDQAEELLVAGGNVDAFCEVAATFASTGGTVLLTVRSDFVDEAAALPHIGTAVARGVYVLGPLDRHALRDAVERPARQAGLRLEPGLVELVLRDAEGHPAALPHLSHAMLETWVRREGAALTVDGYEAAGGIAGAIAQSAEDLYRSLAPDDRELCRSLLLRLVEQTPDGAPVRRRTAAAPLLDDPARRVVLERLTRSRLVALDGDAAVIAHEAVATAWPRLEGWLDEAGAAGRLMSGLATAAQTWHDDGRLDEDLARGARLAALLEWREQTGPDLTAVESEFLGASSARERDDLRAVTERAAHDRRQNRLLRRSLAGVGALLVVALATGGVAGVRTVQATAARQSAERASLVSTSVALDERDPVVGALLAAEAYRRWPDSPDARVALMSAMTTANGLVADTTIPGPADGPLGVAAVPGSRAVVVARPGGALELRDVRTGELVRTLTPPLPVAEMPRAPVLAVSADGTTLGMLRPLPADDGQAGTVEPSFYDLADGHRIGGPLPATGGTGSLALSPDGRTAAWLDRATGELTVVDVAAGTQRRAPAVGTPAADGTDAGAAAFADSGTLLVGTGDGRLRTVDVTTLAVGGTHGTWPSSTNDVVLPLDDGTVVMSGAQGVVRVRVSTGETVWWHHLGATHPLTCGAIAVAVAHDELFCADVQDVQVRDLATGEAVGDPLRFAGGSIGGLALLDDDTLLATPQETNELATWRIDGAGPVSRIVASGLVLRNVSLDGRYLMAATPIRGSAATTRTGPPFSVWDTTTDEKVFPTPDVPIGDDTGLSWLGGSRLLAWGSGPLFSYDLTTGEVGHLGDLDPDLIGYELSPRGGDVYETLDRGDGRLGLQVLDGTTLEATGESYDLEGDVVWDLKFTPDGSRMVVETAWGADGATPGSTWVFDTTTGTLLARGLDGRRAAALTAQGDVVSADQGDIAVYDGRTLRRLRALPQLPGNAQAVMVSADDRTVAVTTDGDTAVALYDLRSGERLGPGLPETTPMFWSAVLRPDGSELAYDVAQGVAIWDLDPQHQYEAACRIASRELTADEWTAYLSDLGPQHPTCADVLGS